MVILGSQQILENSLEDARKQGMFLVSARKVVEEVIGLLKKSTPVEVKITEPWAMPLGMVWVDPVQIFQLIVILGMSPSHSLKGKSRVMDVGVANTTVPQNATGSLATLTPGSYVMLTISDSGRGISSKIMEGSSDPFCRVKAPEEGPDLVGSVVRDILTRQDGTVKVKNAPGKGSLIHVYLLRGDAVADHPSATKNSLPGGHECILFVDDDSDVCDLGRELLQHLGYEVFGFSSSVEALKVFTQSPQRFDLVITDLKMPELSGNNLAYKLQEVRPDIPIILHTGASGSFTHELLEAMGFQACLRKPSPVHEIARTVRTILDKNGESGMR